MTEINKRLRDEIMQARHDFYDYKDTGPKLLFVGPDYHTRLCNKFSEESEPHCEITSLVGRLAFGMVVHLVPSLDGFAVA